MAKINPESIHIMSVALTNANISLIKGKDVLEKEKAFDIAFQTATSLSTEDSKFCKIDFTVEFTPAKHLKEQTDFAASFTIEFVFSIENLEEFKVPVEGTAHGFLLDASLGATLMSIAYSTTRGIILTRTAGTVLESILLPVIDPLKLLEYEQVVP